MVNTEELYEEVGAQLLGRRGKVFTQSLLDAMMGRPTTVALQIMIDWHDLEATVPDLEAETDALFPAILDARLETMPGFTPLMDALEEADIPRGVATSSRLSFVTDILSRLDLEERFHFVLTAENVTCGKPHPEIYQRACTLLGLSPAEVLVLEDSENGCRSAVAAGTYAVAVPGAHSAAHDFAGCRFIADSLADPRIYQALRLSPPTSS
jgi:HAD superfamily hydrolase (TIGR01509 family)